MPYAWRLVRPVLWAVVLVTPLFPLTLYAQTTDEQPVVIQGTPELETLVGAIRDAFVEQYPSIEVQIDPRNGQRGGFEALCSGDVDIVMSSDPIEDGQIAACTRSGQDFIELVLAYEAVTFLATPEANMGCVPQQTMEEVWQLGAAEVTWTDLNSADLDTPVAFYGPDDLAPISLLWRSLVPAGELRDDIVTTDTVANILAKVVEPGSSALAYLSLADYESLEQPETPVYPLEIEDADGTCTAPSVSTLENRTYPLSRTSYLYVNAESAARENVRSFLQFALSDPAGAQAIVPAQGYTAPLAATYEYGLNNLVGNVTGRTFSRPLSPVTISASETGTVTVGGSSMLYGLISPIKSDFTSTYTGATITLDPLGNTAGWADFCAGTVDVLMATRAPSDEELAACAANNIDPYTLDLGYEALVIAVPTGNDWLECVTGDLVTKLLGAGTDEAPAPATWSDLNPEWPASTLLLVVPPLNTGETDYLVFTLTGGNTLVRRPDVTENDDPLYRVQGVANTAQDEANPNNGLTYLWWSEFQGSEAAVRLVQVGESCVAPGADSFADGTYPLAYPVRFYFSRASFDNVLVRAFLWHFFDQKSLDIFAAHPYEGMDLQALKSTQRDEVFAMLADYEAQQAEAAPEATPEATVEPTVEPTAEPTVEPTVEATVEATIEPTVEPTVEPTPEAEVSPTPGS